MAEKSFPPAESETVMHALFVACLIGGAAATALLAMLGALAGVGNGHATQGHTAHGHAHAAPEHGGIHADAGPTHHGGAGRAHAHSGNADRSAGHAPGQNGESNWMGVSALRALSWLNPLGLAAAALWFGGAGLIAEQYSGTLALAFAIVAAIVGAVIVRAVAAAFVRASTPALALTGEGAIATVNAPIRPGNAGEVIYTLEGLRRSCPARSLDGGTIPRGTEVVIVRRERGMAWVSPLMPVDENLAPPSAAERQQTDTGNMR